MNNGANVNQIDRLQRTPLHLAAKNGKFVILENSLWKGVNVVEVSEKMHLISLFR